MTCTARTYRLWAAMLLVIVQALTLHALAQVPQAALRRQHQTPTDSINIVQLEDSISRMEGRISADELAADSLQRANDGEIANMDSTVRIAAPAAMPQDSLQRAIEPKRFVPDPVKATWLALVIPGGGQIYNKKYWKLPIFYGGFAGCTYALTWNNRMYKDYSAAYKDAVNGNWSSKSITDLLPANYLRRTSTSQITSVLKNRKDLYRRYRDLSIFAFVGVYVLSVIDAYVDAELSNFDISPDLSMRIEPAVLGNSQAGTGSYKDKSVGLQCSLTF